MRKIFLFAIFSFLFFGGTINAQQLLWRVGLHSVFDNHEFDQFPMRQSTTIAQTHLQPAIGLGLDSLHHRLFVGIDAQKYWASQRIVDRVMPIAYYQFSIPKFDFYVGAFPKRPLLANYPLMLLSDSAMWARPVMNGIFMQYSHSYKNYVNLWLDWIGQQDSLVYESFFVGFSGRLQMGVFYLQNFTYLYHMVINDIRTDRSGAFNNVKESYKTLLSVGLDFSRKTGMDKLQTDIGISASVERNRGELSDYYPVGLLWQAEAEYRGLEIRNSLYYGKPQMKFYSTFGNYLYWGDLMYRTDFYNRTDLMVNFYKSNILNISLDVSIHWLDKRLVSCQSLKATIDIDNLSNRKIDKSYRYVWDSWFIKKR